MQQEAAVIIRRGGYQNRPVGCSYDSNSKSPAPTTRELFLADVLSYNFSVSL